MSKGIDRRTFLILGGATLASAATIPAQLSIATKTDWHHVCYHRLDGWIKYFLDGELIEFKESPGDDFTFDYWTNGKDIDGARFS